MIRTQVSLDKNEYELAKKQALALGISVAEFIRRAVREQLPIEGQGAWMKYAGFVESGDRASSQSLKEAAQNGCKVNCATRRAKGSLC